MIDSLAIIRARRAEIAKLRKELEEEDAELNQVERTIMRLTASGQGGNGSDKQPSTQREYVIATMRDSKIDWFDSVAALREEVARHGRDIKMTTFQPLVSQMTAAKVLRRDGQRVGLVERVGA